MNNRIKVTFFQRKPRPGFSFSVEYLFEIIRERLENKIDANVITCSLFNDGYYSKFVNIIEAPFHQSGVNHITGEVHFLDLLMKKKNVLLTIHDCGMILRKKGLSRKIVQWLYLSAPIRRARYITAVSEETKKEIIKFTGCPENKIKIIPNPIHPMFQAFPKEFNEEKPNILHVGTAYNKNLPRLIAAVNGLKCHLTIVGRLSADIIESLKKNNIEYTNAYDLSSEELLQKYKECDIVSFVSTFEGLGMPILEGNAIERAVITSNISSMPEVAGKAACLVDPFNADSIRNGLLRILNDREYRNELIREGRINRLRFEPDRIAELYYNMYKMVIDKN
jgi:glycosyltransferase involved in cell wall biosynthesis